MIKKLSIILVFVSLTIKAQVEPCFFDKYQRTHAQAVSNAEAEIQNALLKAGQKLQSNNPNLKVIPVVIHVIHDGGANNISDAQIQTQIDVLNEDFRRKTGTNGFGAGVDTDIEFCLAKKDPLGKCTNGIVRINSPLSNHQTYQRSMLKQLSYWDNTRYLNMYVVKNINNGNGILGYSSFPGGPADEDGIVVKHNYFGRIGTAASSLGRTTTHEIGHWFGLYHTFNNGCGTDTCNGGDFVCDTPPAANPNYGCPTSVNSCTIDNLSDQVRNYLDYSNDNCKNIFTVGQRSRMHATLSTLRDTIWQPWNLDSTGCDSGYISSNCKVIADFVTHTPAICVGNTITFYNKSQNNPTAYQWFFQGGTPSVSSVANPTVTYPALGNFLVKLITTNVYGTDSLLLNNYVIVATPPVGQSLPYSENFESFFFPANGMTIDNPDGGITWERDTIAVAYQGIASAKINNLINTNYGQSDALILPRFNFSTFSGIPYLSFKWAYAKSDPNYSDELLVLVSNNCGVTWSQVFYKSGSTMTTGSTQVTPYIPNSSTVWKAATISLQTYTASSNVQIKIVNVTDGGNNLYVDDINLNAISTNIVGTISNGSQVHVFPNPADDNLNLEYELVKSGSFSYEVIDVIGRMIVSMNLGIQSAGKHSLLLDVTSLAGGIYFIKISMDQNRVIKKIIIDK